MEIIANNKIDRLIEINCELPDITNRQVWEDKILEGILECENIVRKHHDEHTFQACIAFHEMFVNDLARFQDAMMDLDLHHHVELVEVILEIIWID